MSSLTVALEPTSTESIIITSILVIGLVIAATRANILDKNGIIAATILGMAVGGLGGWYWLLTLLVFLLTSHKVTKYRFEEKKLRGMSESDDGHRGWQNVVANGGLAGLVALFSFIFGGELGAGYLVFATAVSVAAADTFASEVGCLDDRVRMITTMKKCEPGVNGGWSPSGQAAAFIGSLLIGIFSLPYLILIGESIAVSVFLIVGVGWLGCQIDSILGATLENRGFLTKGSVNSLSITAGILIVAFSTDWIFF